MKKHPGTRVNEFNNNSAGKCRAVYRIDSEFYVGPAICREEQHVLPHMRTGGMLETYSKTIIDMKGRFKVYFRMDFGRPTNVLRKKKKEEAKEESLPYSESCQEHILKHICY